MRTLWIAASVTVVLGSSAVARAECEGPSDNLDSFLTDFGAVRDAGPATALARQLHGALMNENAGAVRALLAGKSAAEIAAMDAAYLDKYGNSAEFEIRNFHEKLGGLLLGLPQHDKMTPEERAALVELLNGPKANEQAERLAALIAANDRAGVYALLSTLGGPERARLEEAYQALTGRPLAGDLAPVLALPAPAPVHDPKAKKHIAMVVSEAGYHWEEVYGAYEEFRKAGYEVEIFTPNGLPPKPDSLSLMASEKGSRVGFGTDPEAGPDSKYGKEIVGLFSTVRPLSAMNTKEMDALYLPGGHGSHVDMNGNAALHAKVEEFHRDGKVISAVCHATSTLGGAKNEDGTSILAGRKATGFPAPLDERAVGLGMVLPDFLPPFDNDAALRAQGADVSALTVTAGMLNPNYTRVDKSRNPPIVTGTGPKASDDTAREVIKLLDKR